MVASKVAQDVPISVLMDADKEAVKRTWRLVIPIAETAADLFYSRLFEIAPQYKPLFKGDMGAQKRKLITMLSFIVKSLDWKADAWQDDIDEEDDLFLVVLAMGRRHSELYQVPDEAYGSVGSALIWMLGQGLGEAFTKEVQDAWVRVYTLVSLTMKMGQSGADMGKPFEPPEWSEIT